MSIRRPNIPELDAIATRFGLSVAATDMEQYLAASHVALEAWDVVEEAHAEISAPVPERAWNRPTVDDDPFGAWYVRTEIQERTDGPLSGMRVAVKDNTSVAGVPMMNGSLTLEGFTPSRDATVVTRLLQAGAVIAGKSVCEDLCMSGGSHTSKPAPVHNPWDVSRSSGGSSSGSGVLVATGEVDLAISGDQGGSIRVPASWLGLVGHKPTWGLVPYTGAMPVEQSIDHLGPTARSVLDAARMLTVLAGPDGLDPRQPRDMTSVDFAAELGRGSHGLRVGVLLEGFGRPGSDAAVDEAVRTAAHRLEAAGLVVGDVSVPWHLRAPALFAVIAYEGGVAQLVEGNAFGSSWKGHYDEDLIDFYGRQWRRSPDAFPASVIMTMLAGRYARDTGHGRHYAMARNLERSLAAAYDEALSRFDVLVMPTVPTTATPLPSADASVLEVLALGSDPLLNTSAFNITGHPACSVPVGLVDGLPAGMMIVGRQFDDATVLRVAQAVEDQLGDSPRPPVTQETT
ncbi:MULTISPECIES: amidase [unclassified Aeromicrobium]|uniref:amidase n=1 Tax=unclassified Aeromicrobium TaxID=2633570 RepID=UPI0028894187|nr:MULTISPECIES: amidase [unclassified Aeromicrobium]